MALQSRQDFSALPLFQFPFGCVAFGDGVTILSETRSNRLRVVGVDGETIDLVSGYTKPTTAVSKDTGVALEQKRQLEILKRVSLHPNPRYSATQSEESGTRADIQQFSWSLAQPRGMCVVDKYHGIFAVADTGNARVVELRLNGTKVEIVKSISAGILQRPWDVCYHPTCGDGGTGQYIVVDMATNSVKYFDRDSGRLTQEIKLENQEPLLGRPNMQEEQINIAHDCEVGEEQTLEQKHGLKDFLDDDTGAGEEHVFDGPCRIECASLLHQLHVADRHNTRIHILTARGKYVERKPLDSKLMY